ncbi:MAG: hypothetical protein DBX47_04820 [Clostridiales bacterium]|nr:MAG: hypothetical protein DBX47_04820 [Clostridiales bacterium]
MTLIYQLLVELLARGIWEAGLFLYGTLLLAGTEIPKRKFILTAAVFSLIALAVRHLPISFGIHTMIIIVFLNLIVILLFNVTLEQTIKSSVIVTCIMFALEGLNGLVLQLIIGKEEFFNICIDQVSKVLYFTPSMFLFLIVIYVMDKVLKKKRGELNAGRDK